MGANGTLRLNVLLNRTPLGKVVEQCFSPFPQVFLDVFSSGELESRNVKADLKETDVGE